MRRAQSSIHLPTFYGAADVYRPEYAKSPQSSAFGDKTKMSGLGSPQRSESELPSPSKIFNIYPRKDISLAAKSSNPSADCRATSSSMPANSLAAHRQGKGETQTTTPPKSWPLTSQDKEAQQSKPIDQPEPANANQNTDPRTAPSSITPSDSSPFKERNRRPTGDSNGERVESIFESTKKSHRRKRHPSTAPTISSATRGSDRSERSKKGTANGTRSERQTVQPASGKESTPPESMQLHPEGEKRKRSDTGSLQDDTAYTRLYVESQPADSTVTPKNNRKKSKTSSARSCQNITAAQESPELGGSLQRSLLPTLSQSKITATRLHNADGHSSNTPAQHDEYWDDWRPWEDDDSPLRLRSANSNKSSNTSRQRSNETPLPGDEQGSPEIGLPLSHERSIRAAPPPINPPAQATGSRFSQKRGKRHQTEPPRRRQRSLSSTLSPIDLPLQPLPRTLHPARNDPAPAPDFAEFDERLKKMEDRLLQEISQTFRAPNQPEQQQRQSASAVPSTSTANGVASAPNVTNTSANSALAPHRSRQSDEWRLNQLIPTSEHKSDAALIRICKRHKGIKRHDRAVYAFNKRGKLYSKYVHLLTTRGEDGEMVFSPEEILNLSRSA